MFAHAAFSTLKTMVMMIGEIDFGDMLGAGVTHAGIPPREGTQFDGKSLARVNWLKCCLKSS